MAVSIVFVVYGNEAGNRFMGREKKGNLNNRTFLGEVWFADDPRETRDRPAKNTRGDRGKGNLNNRCILKILVVSLQSIYIFRYGVRPNNRW